MMTKDLDCGHTSSPEAELTCRQVTALFVDYLTGDIESLTRTAFEAHLCHCQACTAFFATYRETIRATRAARNEMIDLEEMTDADLDKLQHEFLKVRSRRSGRSE